MQTTIYIRKDNEDAWSKFGKDKSKKVNEWLSGQYTEGDKVNDIPMQPADTSLGSTGRVPQALNIPGVVRGGEFVPKPPDPETGYPCCTANKPCKHWQWDELKSVWVNQITLKEREA